MLDLAHKRNAIKMGLTFLTYKIGKSLKIWQHTLLIRLWQNRYSDTLMMGIQNNTTLKKENSAMSSKISHMHIIIFLSTPLLGNFTAYTQTKKRFFKKWCIRLLTDTYYDRKWGDVGGEGAQTHISPKHTLTHTRQSKSPSMIENNVVYPNNYQM